MQVNFFPAVKVRDGMRSRGVVLVKMNRSGVEDDLV